MTAERSKAEAYAHAMLEVGRAEGRLPEVEDDLFRFARTLEASDDLRLALTDPSLPVERRIAVIEDSRQAAEGVRRDLIAKAEADAAEIRTRAQEDIRLAQERAMTDLRAQVADLSIELAEKVVERNLDRDTQIALIENYINTVGNGHR